MKLRWMIVYRYNLLPDDPGLKYELEFIRPILNGDLITSFVCNYIRKKRNIGFRLQKSNTIRVAVPLEVHRALHHRIIADRDVFSLGTRRGNAKRIVFAVMVTSTRVMATIESLGPVSSRTSRVIKD
ncbi:hypothetical protein PC116_g4542 [Phytophthora cactorum]|nr:hypothetical protein PC114_g5744 [Phytophthora cactorum]KAG3099914.1 hypothetical protein PC122_g3364 [Phytophthora cactorum]KAG3188293.1 hypothetical protein C6341_g2847 [Phytophthora cactorum]KAG4247694.1 hypothetical protein PC116_g4542 [Phytophthora cactorum]